MIKILSFRKYSVLIVVAFINIVSYAQTEEETELPVKVHHIEPLYIDLVRDLGARKGEKEINIGGEFVNTSSYSIFKTLAEYEFAPINRLGLEIEADFSFYDVYTDEDIISGNSMDELIMYVLYF